MEENEKQLFTAARRPVQDMQSVRQKPVGYDEFPPEEANLQTVSRGIPGQPGAALYYSQQVHPVGSQPTGPQTFQTGTGIPPQSFPQASPSGSFSPVYDQPFQNSVPNPPFVQTGPYGNPQPGFVPELHHSAGYPPVGAFTPAPPSVGNDPLIADEPFEATSIQDEILKNRSTGVFDRNNPFWEAPGKAEKKARRKKILRTVFTTLGVLILGTLILLYAVVFRVHTANIYVPDVDEYSAQRVRQLSGLKDGDSIFAVNEDDVRAAFAQDRYIIFKGMEKVMPSSIIIRVTIRKPEAVISYCGINYFIDKEGMVLEENEDLNADRGMIVISGMNIGPGGCSVGRVISVTDREQFDLLKEMLLELKVLSLTSEVSRANMTSQDGTLLETRSGFSVKLGDTTNIHAKLKAMKYTILELKKLGKIGGTIDVSDPPNPSFIPE